MHSPDFHICNLVFLASLPESAGGSLMPGQHTEKAFETAIEEHLIAVGGYARGDHEAFDPRRGLFPQDVIDRLVSDLFSPMDIELPRSRTGMMIWRTWTKSIGTWFTRDTGRTMSMTWTDRGVSKRSFSFTGSVTGN